jgi:hypothetical protein
MNFLLLCLLILACYRVANLISKDVITEFFRAWLGRLASNRNSFWMFVAELFHCPYCLGVWIAAVLAIPVSRSLLEWLLHTLAIAGGQYLLQELSDHA